MSFGDFLRVNPLKSFVYFTANQDILSEKLRILRNEHALST